MKKLLYYIMATLGISLLPNCTDSKKTKPVDSVTTQAAVRQDSNKVHPHVPSQLIVNLKKPGSRAAFLKAASDLGYTLAASCPCSENLILLNAPPRVELNPDGEIKGTASGNDTGGGVGSGVSRNYTFEQTSVGKSNGNIPFINVSRNPRNSNVVVSIIDSGIDFENPVIQPYLFLNLAPYKYCGINKDGRFGLNMFAATETGTTPVSFEPTEVSGHGTFIDGIIAGKARINKVDKTVSRPFTDNDDNIMFKLLNVAFTKPLTKQGTLFDALCGIHYSLEKKAKIINASWGLETFSNRTSEMMVFNPTLEALVDRKNDALLVTSAGNHEISFDTDPSNRLAWPAAFSRAQVIDDTTLNFSNNVITVGAWNLSENTIASFSNRGNIVDIYAPGFDVLSLCWVDRGIYGEDLSRNQGTSFAAPYVVRTAASIKHLRPTLKSERIKQIIMETSIGRRGTIGGSTVRLLRHRNAVSVRR